MTPAPKRRWSFSLRTLFVILLACGLWQIFMGLVIVPVRPYVQLDAVLSHDELADEATREKTLTLLQRASGNESFFWLAPGITVSIVSAMGLWSVRAEKPSPHI